MKYTFSLLFTLFSLQAFTQTISVTVNATSGLTPISPWIYGRNNNLSDDPSKPVSSTLWQQYNDAGLRMYRENGGNNATKYNWRLKLSSHPDWYNNVYSHNWDYSASSLLSNTSNTQGLYAFQLLGKAAFNTSHNFNDWAYDGSQGGGSGNNWAGGGGPTAGNGNPSLYLEDWTADSTVGILNHWFNDLHLDANRLKYWNMDNEPEIWQYTHDDVASSAITAEDFIQKYFAVAKKARAAFPGVKLVGPVSPNEWQWYTWNNSKVTYNGITYTWMEYFIKRIADEQKATGIRLLDVLDVHFYPGTEKYPDTTLQLHRLWFDTQWVYPLANGVKVSGTSGWDNSINKEYFFERCNQWLNKHIGPDHGVTFGISEYGAIAKHGSENPNVIACWYASHLGTFANHGVELFTPWDWYTGQWEVLHLFSKYYGTLATQAVSDNETVASAYSSVSSDGDSLMIAIVNRDRTNSRTINVNIQNFTPSSTTVNGYELSNLPSSETFVSGSDNALTSKQYTITGNTISLTVPKLSVTMIQIPTNNPVISGIRPAANSHFNIYPNPTKNKLLIRSDKEGDYKVVIQDMMGKALGSWSETGNAELDLTNYAAGNYILHIIQDNDVWVQKIIKD